MRLSTSTNLMDRFQKAQGAVSMQECLERCFQAGYRVMDMNFHDMSNPGMPMSGDGWRDWLSRIRELAASLGLEFSQAHAYFYHFCNPRIADREWREELITRSFVGAGTLGIPWMVMHASTWKETGFSFRISREKNLEQFKRWLELAHRYQVGIAIENLYDPLDTFSRTYSSAPEELIDLVDSLDDELVGICWDFGHGNLSATDQNESLRLVGSRLKALHVNDNDKLKDRHLLPFYGEIDWPPLMRTLREIGYQNDLTFECTPFLVGCRRPCVRRQLEHTVEVGEYLIRLVQGEDESL